MKTLVCALLGALVAGLVLLVYVSIGITTRTLPPFEFAPDITAAIIAAGVGAGALAAVFAGNDE